MLHVMGGPTQRAPRRVWNGSESIHERVRACELNKQTQSWQTQATLVRTRKPTRPLENTQPTNNPQILSNLFTQPFSHPITGP